MSDDREDEAFLSRWSRRKIEARKAQDEPAKLGPAPTPAATPVVPDAKTAMSQAGASAPVELPPLESLKGLASEYRDFMRPGVDESLKRSALKKLFKDPHFENFERFAEYCEDYTQGEPIPLAMLKTLEHAKGLIFDEEKKKEEERKEGEEIVEAKPEAVVRQPDAPQPQAPVESGLSRASAKPEPKA
jgi:hypothetical protein